jgi:hypothetical protein
MICGYCKKEMREESGFTGLFHVNETDAMNCFREQRRIVEPKPVSNSCNRHSDCEAMVDSDTRYDDMDIGYRQTHNH